MRLSPIVNWRMVTFSFVAMDQIVNQASKVRYMFGGQADFPVTYRCSTGGGMGLAAQHSQSPYSMWMHLAGLKIILPATPADAKGLLKSAIRDNNPVVSFECSRLNTVVGRCPMATTAPLCRSGAGSTDVTRRPASMCRKCWRWPTSWPPGYLGRSHRSAHARPADVETIRASVRRPPPRHRRRGATHLLSGL
jgi:hypothetical protein